MNDEQQKVFQTELGLHIKKIRKEKKMSQSEVANRCGKERQSYQRVENGTINATAWYLNNIATALQVELKDLFDFEMTKPKL